MRWMIALLLGLGLTTPAWADTCFVREYSAEHLRKNPNQNVSEMRLRLMESPERWATAIVRFRDTKKEYRQSFGCYDPDQKEFPGSFVSCSVDCDGGFFVARKRGKDAILVDVPWGFIVSGGCGAEDEEIRNVSDTGAEGTTFKLYRAELSACK